MFIPFPQRELVVAVAYHKVTLQKLLSLSQNHISPAPVTWCRQGPQQEAHSGGVEHKHKHKNSTSSPGGGGGGVS